MSGFDFEWCVGHEYEFYGVDNCQFKLGINGTSIVLEAEEDPDDGYRSYLRTIEVVDERVGIFFGRPIAKVRVISYENDKSGENRYDAFSGYHLVDVDTGHVWLRVGTDNSDDWYPMFTFDYEPRKDQLIQESVLE